MSFHVGQKVVCVDAGPPKGRDHQGQPSGLVKGSLYVVLDIYNGPQRGARGHVRIDERYAFFAAERFRPIVDRTTDISIFTAMLAPNKPKVDA